MQPTCLYYSILNYQPSSLRLLHENFKVITLPDPDADTKEIMRDVEVTFAPLGFYCGKEKIDACPRLRAIASNTTGDPHIDVQYAESRGIAVITLRDVGPYASYD
jgi:D-3-phosphoglycerate dehydrogenase